MDGTSVDIWHQLTFWSAAICRPVCSFTGGFHDAVIGMESEALHTVAMAIPLCATELPRHLLEFHRMVPICGERSLTRFEFCDDTFFAVRSFYLLL